MSSIAIVIFDPYSSINYSLENILYHLTAADTFIAASYLDASMGSIEIVAMVGSIKMIL